MSQPHGSSGGDHSGLSLKGLDAALLQSQLVCLLFIFVSVCVTMYRGTVRPCCFRPPPPPPPGLLTHCLCTPHICCCSQAWHNDGWHLPMVAALAFSTWLKLSSREFAEEKHSA